MRATKVNAGLAESNGRLLLGIWRDSLHVTCGPTACTPGSAPGPTLGNEYGKTLPFFTIKSHLSNRTSLCSASYVSCKRGTARICCCAPCCGPVLLRHRPCSSRSISPTRRAHSSKPAARFCSGGIGQTDGQTDAVPLNRPCSAYYAGRANNQRCRSERVTSDTAS